MNRIYQGKVTNVEILTAEFPSLEGMQGVGSSADGKPVPLDNWQQALPAVPPKPCEGGWQHHQLFQAEFDERPLSCAANAVNYYTLALAALA